MNFIELEYKHLYILLDKQFFAVIDNTFLYLNKINLKQNKFEVTLYFWKKYFHDFIGL
jgi:hypothetical protein